jgi:hypothetical protein
VEEPCFPSTIVTFCETSGRQHLFSGDLECEGKAPFIAFIAEQLGSYWMLIKL